MPLRLTLSATATQLQGVVTWPKLRLQSKKTKRREVERETERRETKELLDSAEATLQRAVTDINKWRTSSQLWQNAHQAAQRVAEEQLEEQLEIARVKHETETEALRSHVQELEAEVDGWMRINNEHVLEEWERQGRPDPEKQKLHKRLYSEDLSESSDVYPDVAWEPETLASWIESVKEGLVYWGGPLGSTGGLSQRDVYPPRVAIPTGNMLVWNYTEGVEPMVWPEQRPPINTTVHYQADIPHAPFPPSPKEGDWFTDANLNNYKFVEGEWKHIPFGNWNV